MRSPPHGDMLSPHLCEVSKTNNKHISFIIYNKGIACRGVHESGWVWLMGKKDPIQSIEIGSDWVVFLKF